MRQFNVLFRWGWTFLVVVTLGLAGCDGDDGAAGAAGAAGQPGADGLACWDLNGNGVGDLPDEDLDGDGVVDAFDCNANAATERAAINAAVDAAKPESCATCHGDVGVEEHQSVYDKYVDASTLALTINSVTSLLVAGPPDTYTVTVNFSIAKNGLAFTDFNALEERRFLANIYDSAANQYLNGLVTLNEDDPDTGIALNVVMVADGDYVLTKAGLTFDPTANGQVYGYIAQGVLVQHVGGTGAEFAVDAHVHLYDDVANAALAFGDASSAGANPYESAANVSGCQKCHGTPYLKHGFRNPIVAGLPDFASCKTCHNDDGFGFTQAWQYMVDEPFNWATGVASTADYAYRRTLMNDVHMAHAMEFPYPQSMSNCNTCHENKLAQILDNSNFRLEVCKSCHAIQGIDAWPKTFNPDGSEILSRGNSVGEKYAQGNRAPPFEFLWTHNTAQNYVVLHQQVLASADQDCTVCHEANGIAPMLSELHTGYNASIYDANGVKYATQYTVQIDLVTWDAVAGTLKIDYSANDPAIVPEVLVSFYGWDSKNFIIPSHARDGSLGACSDTRGCRFEFESDPADTNPLFSDFAEVTPGVWTVTANLAAFVPAETKDILTLISDGVIKNAEISITPTLNLAGKAVVLKAVGRTVSLQDGLEVVDYFKGADSTVDITKCNACHDALASSFHDGTGRGGDGVEVCKNCHNPTFTGGHIEMASRSIDNYVHAIHTFQDFDVDDTFNDTVGGVTVPGFDPVLAKRYDQHTKHVFPNFTIRNCEACHRAGKYNVPDQSQSMPGVASSSSDVLTWYQLVDGLAVEDTGGRNIGTVKELVMGPAARACGGCHRARLIRDDAAGDLASFNEHTKAGGTLVENDSDDEVLFKVIDKIMGLFE
ncbi:MAG: hypothetical protein OEM20_00135 [Gammaproteobacteria bacterium]|nr:hypothetical protein [Gammaproteobacteria bacterium]